jgi:hypothetical protein
LLYIQVITRKTQTRYERHFEKHFLNAQIAPNSNFVNGGFFQSVLNPPFPIKRVLGVLSDHESGSSAMTIIGAMVYQVLDGKKRTQPLFYPAAFFLLQKWIFIAFGETLSPQLTPLNVENGGSVVTRVFAFYL